jgi:hypothetical protein
MFWSEQGAGGTSAGEVDLVGTIPLIERPDNEVADGDNLTLAPAH